MGAVILDGTGNSCRWEIAKLRDLYHAQGRVSVLFCCNSVGAASLGDCLANRAFFANRTLKSFFGLKGRRSSLPARMAARASFSFVPNNVGQGLVGPKVHGAEVAPCLSLRSFRRGLNGGALWLA